MIDKPDGYARFDCSLYMPYAATLKPRIGNSKKKEKPIAAKRAVGGRNKPLGTTLRADEISPPVGMKRHAGDWTIPVTLHSTAKASKNLWLGTRTCSHCHARGLVSNGSVWGTCYNCYLLTKLV